MICDRNCFSCPHDDCVADDITREEMAMSAAIDRRAKLSPLSDDEKKAKELKRIRGREYYHTHRERELTRSKTYYHTHRDEVLAKRAARYPAEHYRQYYAANRERILANARARYHRKRAALAGGEV